MQNALDYYHPATAAGLLGACVGITLLCYHPVYAALSFLGACCFLLCLRGARALLRTLRTCSLLLIATVLLNALFNQNGVTVLFYLGSRPILREGLVYGVCAAFVLCSMLLWFHALTQALHTQRLLYLFRGRLSGTGLVLCMILRRLQIMRKDMPALLQLHSGQAQGFVQKIRSAGQAFSCLMNNTLEDAVQMADSMRARGYGSGTRSNAKRYRLQKRDILVWCLLAALFAPVLVQLLRGNTAFVFYPLTQAVAWDLPSVTGYLGAALLFLLPTGIVLLEEHKWNYSLCKA